MRLMNMAGALMSYHSLRVKGSTLRGRTWRGGERRAGRVRRNWHRRRRPATRHAHLLLLALAALREALVLAASQTRGQSRATPGRYTSTNCTRQGARHANHMQCQPHRPRPACRHAHPACQPPHARHTRAQSHITLCLPDSHGDTAGGWVGGWETLRCCRSGGASKAVAGGARRGKTGNKWFVI